MRTRDTKPAPVGDAPEQRATYHHGDLRRALLEEATALIAEVGADAFTLRELARRVGVNHRAAYRHFASKEDLLATIAEQGYDGLVASLRRELVGVAEGDPVARLHVLCHGYVRFAVESPAAYGVMFGRRLNEDGRFPAIERPIDEAVALLATELGRGQDLGVIAPEPVRELGLAMWAAMHGIASLVITRRIRVSARKRAAYVATLFAPTVRGLTRR